MSFIKKSYDVFHWPKIFPTPFSLCHTPSLFLNGIMKNQVLNKIFCSMMKHFKATLMFSIYNKYKEGKNNFLNINMSRNKKSLCKNKNISGKRVLGDAS
jgi:hypothetical protein